MAREQRNIEYRDAHIEQIWQKLNPISERLTFEKINDAQDPGYDFKISQDGQTLMLIEIVPFLTMGALRIIQASKLREIAKHQQASYATITTGDRFFVCELKKVKDGLLSEEAYTEYTLERFADLLNELECPKSKQQVLYNAFIDFANKQTDEEGSNHLKTLKISDIIVEGTDYYFDEKFEDDLLNFTLDSFDENQVCRYTTLNTLYYMLTNKTVRMFGLAGMNDKGERDFLYKALYPNSKDSDMGEEHNTSYIMSCSPMCLKDKLEMWRLYADDAKGVCLVYDINYDLFKKRIDELMLYPVIYDKLDDGTPNPKFEFLRGLVEVANSLNISFKLRLFEKWKAFFKSSDYIYEKEIRLLYQNESSSGWIKTDSNGIFAPYAEFSLLINPHKQQLPLTLKEIILGPKCPEQDVNRQQIEALIYKDKELAKLGIKVSTSRITNYR